MTPSREPESPRRRLPLLWMLAGLALVVASVAGAGWALNQNGKAEAPPPAGSAPPANGSARRSVAFGHVDVRGGVIKVLAPQAGRVAKVEPDLEEREVNEGA